MLAVGTTLTLEVERPAVGGAMLARHEGEVVLVEGAIPGELVRARVHDRSRNVAHATAVDIMRASPDRVMAHGAACGGRDYAHITPARQRLLKREQVVDALRRIAKRPDVVVHDTRGDDRKGFRLRARLHWDGERLGFLRTGSHAVCLEGVEAQFSVSAAALLERIRASLACCRSAATVDVAESVCESWRALRVALPPHEVPALTRAVEPWVDSSAGLIIDATPGSAGVAFGRTVVTESWSALGVVATDPRLGAGLPAGEVLPQVSGFGLQRQPHAFFQGHRFVLPALVADVLSRVHTPRVVDLYAGVGLFGLGAACQGAEHVWCVEGDPVSSADLAANASPFGSRVMVAATSVERWLAGQAHPTDCTILIDPPRTGLSREAVDGIVRSRAATLVYVSCDPATFARDVARLAQNGFEMQSVQPYDLFPDTSHVEVVTTLSRTLHA